MILLMMTSLLFTDSVTLFLAEKTSCRVDAAVIFAARSVCFATPACRAVLLCCDSTNSSWVIKVFSAGGTTDVAFCYRSGICVFNPTNKGM